MEFIRWGDVVFGLLACFDNKVPPGGEIIKFFLLKIEILNLRFQRAQKITKTPPVALMAGQNVPQGQGKKYRHFRATTKFWTTCTKMAPAHTPLNQSSCCSPIWIRLFEANILRQKYRIFMHIFPDDSSKQWPVHLRYCCFR